MVQKTVIALLLSLLLGLLLSACEVFHCNCYCSSYDSTDLTLNDTVELKFNEQYCDSEHKFLLRIDSISDGRCPIGMMCIWEGNASIKLILKHDAEEVNTFWLDTHDGFLNDTLVHGIRFELIDILPYPEVGKDYQPDDYIVQMLITD